MNPWLRKIHTGPLVFVLALGWPAHAIQQHRTVITTTVAATSVEVGVYGPDGRAVRDLRASDFLVIEDDQARETIDAELYEVDALLDKNPWPGADRDVSSNRQPSQEAIVALFLDDATPMLAVDGLRVRQIAEQVIERMPAGDLGSVSFALASDDQVPPTLDRSALRAAAGRFQASVSVGSIVSQGATTGAPGMSAVYRLDESSISLYEQMLRRLHQLIENLAHQPYLSKSVLVVSIGLPLSDRDVERGAGASLSASLRRQLLDVIHAARNAGVRIYGVDPGGLRSSFGDIRDASGAATSQMSHGRANREFLVSLSEGTGGFALLNRNEPQQAIDRLLREARSFYIVRYVTTPSSSRKPLPPRVDVRREGVTVRLMRQPFSNGSDTTRPAPSGIAAGLGRMLAQIPLDVSLIPVPATYGSGAVIAAVVGVRRSTLSDTEARREHLTTVVSAYDDAGRPVASRTTQVKATLPAATASIRYDVLARLDVPPGSYIVKVAVESQTTKEIGSVFQRVVVPDFSSRPVTLSQLALGVVPSGTAGPAEALQGVLPIIPTSLREFTTAQTLVGAMQVAYTGTRPSDLPLRVRIVNESGREVFVERTGIDGSRFTPNRSVPFQIRVPLADLSPGEYLLAVETENAPPGFTSGPERRTVQLRIVQR